MRKVVHYVMLLSVVLLMSFSALHKFYLSVTELTYSEADQSFRIVSRVFIDDLDAVLLARYDIDAKLTTEYEHEMAEFYLEKYFKTKLLLKANGELLDLRILGHKVDKDQLVFFIEVPYKELDMLETLTVENQVLMDLFEEQQNIVHLDLKGEKKSLMLIRERPSKMLKY